jgi:hypothetical protein
MVREMKRKLVTVVCVAAFLSASVSRCSAADDLEMAADVVLVRPACIVATIFGSALFVVSLPFAIPSKSVKSAAHEFVVRPAKAAFVRPLGDMHGMYD